MVIMPFSLKTRNMHEQGSVTTRVSFQRLKKKTAFTLMSEKPKKNIRVPLSK
jgi:hypothetical protein